MPSRCNWILIHILFDRLTFRMPQYEEQFRKLLIFDFFIFVCIVTFGLIYNLFSN